MVFRWLTERRRNKILETEFPPTWTTILEKNVAAYELLDDDEQQRLRELVQVFLAEKNFEGCGGLELTDEMRVTIAGTGCLMLLGRDHDLFSEVESILVYPSTVVATDLGRSVFDTSGRPVEEGKAVLGLAVKGGAVVLAWDSALQGAKDARDGHNVVIHELAHKIDFIDGSADGTPEFETHAERHAWAAALGPAFLAHKARAEKGKRSFLDDYAITNEAEYFAVASEAFFEKPKAFAKQLPDVYRSLADFYKLDLAARVNDDETPAKKKKAKPAARKGAAPTFRKTAAMAVVALPAELEAELGAAPTATSATKAAPSNAAKNEPSVVAGAAPGRKSAPAATKAAPSRKSESAIATKTAPSRKSESAATKSAPSGKSEPGIATTTPSRKSESAIATNSAQTRENEPATATKTAPSRKTEHNITATVPPSRKTGPASASKAAPSRRTEHSIAATVAPSRKTGPASANKAAHSRRSDPALAMKSAPSRKSESAIATNSAPSRKSESAIATTSEPSRQSEPTIAPPAPRFRKTAAMAVVALPDDDTPPARPAPPKSRPASR